MGFFSRKKKSAEDGSAPTGVASHRTSGGEDTNIKVKADAKTDLPAETSAKAGVKVEKKDEAQPAVKAVKTDKKPINKNEDKPEVKKTVKKSDGNIKGAFSPKAYETLLRPLITEKASEISVLNKYVFAIDPRMNKIDVKKAIRTIYKVDPVKVNILNFSGKKVRYGKTRGKTKSWKKAVVTLRKGDSIEVYEGV